MICVFLATRHESKFYPLTRDIPKPLLKVKDKAILDRLIDDIDSSGRVNKYIIISSSEFAGKFREWSKTKNQNITIVGVRNTDEQRCPWHINIIRSVIDSLYLDEDLLIIPGDIVLEYSLTDFIEYALNKDKSCILRYYEKRLAMIQSSNVLTMEEDRIVDLEAKPARPKTHWCSLPFYFLRRTDIPYIMGVTDTDSNINDMASFISWLCTKEEVYAYEVKGKTYTITNLASYKKIQKI